MCGAPYDDKSFMVKVAETGDLLCPDCLVAWKERAKAKWELDWRFKEGMINSARRLL